MSPPPAPGQAMGPPNPEGGNRQAGGGEQGEQLFSEFLGNIVNALYDERTASALANVFQTAARAGGRAGPGGPSPVEPLAQAISGAVARVAYSGLSKGLPITPDMAAAAMASMAADLGTNLAETVGAKPLSEEQIQAVYLRGMELLAEQRDEGEKGGPAPAGAGGPQGGGGPASAPTSPPPAGPPPAV